MKHLVAVSLMTLSVAAFGQRQDVLPSEQVTLEDCIEMAAGNYPQIRELNLIESSLGYELDNISLGWVPKFGISGKAGWQSEVVELPFDIQGFTFDIPHYQYSISAEITQQIWDGGASHARKGLVKADAAVQTAQVQVSMYQIRSRVQDLYLGILLLDSQIALNDLLRESLERNAATVEAMMEAGVAYRSDMDMVQVNLLSCTQTEMELAADRAAYVKMLGLFTGEDLSAAVFEMPRTDDGVGCNVAEAASAIGFLMAGPNRPEMLLYDARLGQSEAQRRQLNSLISPKFSLVVQGAYARPGLNFFDPDFSPYMTVGINMKWDFGQLYTRRNDIRRIEAGAGMIQAEKDAFLLNTSVEIAQKRSAIDKAREMLSNDDGIISLRESIRRAAEEQFRSGAIRMTDLMDAIDDENEARIARTVHQIQLLMAVYDLKFTLGHEDF